MNQPVRKMVLSAAAVGLLLLASAPPARAAADEPAAKPSARPDAPPSAETKLSKEMEALRDRIRRTLALYFHQPINTSDNTPAEVLAFCLPYGCDTEVRYGNTAGTAISGVGCLCWNYPCAGYELLTADGSRVVARVGYGLQEKPSQLLAVLAQAAVPASYEIRVGKQRATVADLVESEQRDCRAGADGAFKLIGMAFYVRNGDAWKNSLGETWTVERLLGEELGRSAPRSTSDATDHLMGISYAVERQRRLGKPLEGQFGRAKEFIDEFHAYALGLQNADGTWHPDFFAAKGPGNDHVGSLRSTGHVLAWLAYSLPEARLQEPRIVKAVTWVAEFLESNAPRWNVTSSTPRETGAVGHALHALRIYDRRVFKSADKDRPDPAQEAADKPS